MFDPYDDSTLKKSTSGKWTLKGIDLTSGDCLDVYIEGHWIRIKIEHDKHGYYAIPGSVRLHKGLWARFIGDYTD